jgi:hypothetical protein
LPLPVPNDPGLSGGTLYFQAAIADATVTGFALTNAIQATIY